MKLSDIKPLYATSGEVEEDEFDIENKGMMFDILRNKMYSNPIAAICREITSNARDAHREVGKFDVPIQIHLPTGLEPVYQIKDFGPGISPDRMRNVFIKYTASTKRNDNIQTGGFGLGAKTPFSYSDQFEVTTIVDGIKYSYVCAIDETKIGKIVLLDKRSTDEPNGTEISIPVKHQDFQLFKQWTELACRHWDVKPQALNVNIEWQTFNKVLEGEGWAIAASSDWQRTAKLVIDGIEYPLELEALRKYADSKLIDSTSGIFIMYFGVGELSLSATREQIHLDKPTQEKIRDRLNKITQEIKKKVHDKIEAFPNLWDANVYYRADLLRTFNNLAFLGNLAWHGCPLQNGYMNIDKCRVLHFTKGKYSRKYGTDPNKLSRGASSYINFEENSALYVNDVDLKDITAKHVKKAFDDNPKLRSIQVICLNDKISEDDINKEIFLDKMGPHRISELFTPSSKKKKTSGTRLLLFKFEQASQSFKQVSYGSLEEDTNHKILCRLTKAEAQHWPNNSTRNLILYNGTVMRPRDLTSLFSLKKDVSFYGIDESVNQARIDEEFSNFEDINSFIEENVLNNNKTNFVEIKYAQNHRYEVDERVLAHFDYFEKNIADPKSTFLTYLHLHQKIKKLNEQEYGLMIIYELFKGEIGEKEIKKFLKSNPEWDIFSISEKCQKKYPLIGPPRIYYFADVLDAAVLYINLIDKN